MKIRIVQIENQLDEIHEIEGDSGDEFYPYIASIFPTISTEHWHQDFPWFLSIDAPNCTFYVCSDKSEHFHRENVLDG